MRESKASKFSVGDKVRINPAYGVHLMAGVVLTVERITTWGCGRDYHLVYNPRPDGSADYRTRESAEYLLPVK